jgi:hypothetical protein
MNKKAAIEMPVSFLVAVIIAIVFFSFATYLGLRMMSGAEEYSDTLSEQNKAQIEHMLDSGHDSVVMPFKTKNVLRNELTLFGLGVRNVVGNYDATTRPFEVIVTHNDGKSDHDIATCNGCLKTRAGEASPVPISVSENQKGMVSIGILPDAGDSDGTCAYSVDVCYRVDELDTNNPSTTCDGGDVLPDFYTETMLIKAVLKS